MAMEGFSEADISSFFSGTYLAAAPAASSAAAAAPAAPAVDDR